MEHFEELSLDSTQHKASPWLWYIDDIFVVWSHGPEQLQNFLSHINNLRPTIQFTEEIVSVICFGDGLVIRKEMTMATRVYRNPTHAGRYFSFSFNHLQHVKRVQFRVFTVELPPYAKNDNICVMKLVAWDMIFSSTVILKVLLTRLIIPRVTVVGINRKSLWALCISLM
jgi:hypothetical protein